MISLIWAMDKNRVIGKDNRLPWHLPADLQFFKRVTMGSPIAMGRKTFESIGKPLPGRENIVITRNPSFKPEGCRTVSSVQELIRAYQDLDTELFIIGGADIFKQVLPYADRLYVTLIHESFEGDTFFPDFEIDEWQLESREKGIKDEKNVYDFEFLSYVKKA